MKKFDIVEFNLDLYPQSLWVANNGCIDIATKYFTYQDGKPISLKEIDYVAALTLPVQNIASGKNGVLVINFKKKFAWAVAAHEAVHVADAIFDYIGACSQSFQDKNEPYAYLVQWVVSCMESVNKMDYEKSMDSESKE